MSGYDLILYTPPPPSTDTLLTEEKVHKEQEGQ